MNDDLSRITKLTSTDQRSIKVCRVVSVSSGTATIRMPDGGTRTAYAADNYSTGDQVNVDIAGSTATITGSANLQATGGLKTVIRS